MKSFRVSLRAALCLLLGAGACKPIAETELPGLYVAEHAFAVESVTVRLGGTYIQRVTLRDTHRSLELIDLEQDIVFDDKFLELENGFGERNQDFEHPAWKARSMLPVRRSFRRIQIGVDPGVPYEKVRD